MKFCYLWQFGWTWKYINVNESGKRKTNAMYSYFMWNLNVWNLYTQKVEQWLQKAEGPQEIMINYKVSDEQAKCFTVILHSLITEGLDFFIFQTAKSWLKILLLE